MDSPDIRSLLFVPGDQERRIGKALASQADAVIVDLEDAVLPAEKTRARSIVGEALKQRHGSKPVLVRLNAFDTGMTAADLAAVMPVRPWGVMLPKCQGSAELLHLAHYLEVLEVREGIEPGATRIAIVATESATATMNLSQPAGMSNPRLWGLLWGGEDLSASLGALKNRDEAGDYTFPYAHARSQCLYASNVLGARAIDAVYTRLDDTAGLERETRTALRDGFTAKAAIHPAQVEIINRLLSVTSEQVDWAKRVNEALQTSAVARVDGAFVDRAHGRIAERFLRRFHAHGSA